MTPCPCLLNASPRKEEEEATVEIPRLYRQPMTGARPAPDRRPTGARRLADQRRRPASLQRAWLFQRYACILFRYQIYNTVPLFEESPTRRLHD